METTTVMETATVGETITTGAITGTVAMMIATGGIPIAGGVRAATATGDARDLGRQSRNQENRNISRKGAKAAKGRRPRRVRSAHHFVAWMWRSGIRVFRPQFAQAAKLLKHSPTRTQFCRAQHAAPLRPKGSGEEFAQASQNFNYSSTRSHERNFLRTATIGIRSLSHRFIGSHHT
jgi:hypothetical protein